MPQPFGVLASNCLGHDWLAELPACLNDRAVELGGLAIQDSYALVANMNVNRIIIQKFFRLRCEQYENVVRLIIDSGTPWNA